MGALCLPSPWTGKSFRGWNPLPLCLRSIQRWTNKHWQCSPVQKKIQSRTLQTTLVTGNGHPFGFLPAKVEWLTLARHKCGQRNAKHESWNRMLKMQIASTNQMTMSLLNCNKQMHSSTILCSRWHSLAQQQFQSWHCFGQWFSTNYSFLHINTTRRNGAPLLCGNKILVPQQQKEIIFYLCPEH